MYSQPNEFDELILNLIKYLCHLRKRKERKKKETSTLTLKDRYRSFNISFIFYIIKIREPNIIFNFPIL